MHGCFCHSCRDRNLMPLRDRGFSLQGQAESQLCKIGDVGIKELRDLPNHKETKGGIHGEEKSCDDHNCLSGISKCFPFI